MKNRYARNLNNTFRGGGEVREYSHIKAVLQDQACIQNPFFTVFLNRYVMLQFFPPTLMHSSHQIILFKLSLRLTFLLYSGVNKDSDMYTVQ